MEETKMHVNDVVLLGGVVTIALFFASIALFGIAKKFFKWARTMKGMWGDIHEDYGG